MRLSIFAFPALFIATLLMLTATGFFNTYISLYLEKHQVSSMIIGASIASYYFGMVLGTKAGQLLIAGFGHIRTFVACAGICTIVILSHTLIENIYVWMMFRFTLGLAMMAQYMVIESWLNEQSDSKNRGAVFSGYMIAVNIGLICGQFLLKYFPELGFKQLVMIAILFAASLIPVATTRKIHPNAIIAAPLEIQYFLRTVSPALMTVAISGMMVGSFFGLAPVYAKSIGLSNQDSSQFVAFGMIAGFLIQWPAGWLSDKINRMRLIQGFALLLAIASIPLWFGAFWSKTLLLTFVFFIGVFLFPLYPVGVALANDNIAPSKRVALSGLLLAIFGVGAGLGPIITGLFMDVFSSRVMFTLFFVLALSLFGLMFVLKSKPCENSDPDSEKTPHVPEYPMSSAIIDPRIEIDEVPEENKIILEHIEPRNDKQNSNEADEADEANEAKESNDSVLDAEIKENAPSFDTNKNN